MNVLDEILISYLTDVQGEKIPEENWEEVVEEIMDEDYGEDKYSYLVLEIMGRNYYGEWFKNRCPEQAAWAETNGFKQVHQDGGGEGGGEYCEMVFSWRGKFYHISYSYYSYDGYDLSGVEHTISEVKPVQKMVTVYE